MDATRRKELFAHLRLHRDFNDKANQLLDCHNYSQIRKGEAIGPVSEFCNAELAKMRAAMTSAPEREHESNSFLLAVVAQLEHRVASSAYSRRDEAKKTELAKKDANISHEKYVQAAQRNSDKQAILEKMEAELSKKDKAMKEMEQQLKEYQIKEAAANFVIYKEKFPEMEKQLEQMKKENDEIKKFKAAPELKDAEMRQMFEKILKDNEEMKQFKAAHEKKYADMQQICEKLLRENEQMKQFKVQQEGKDDEMREMCDQIFRHVMELQNDEQGPMEQ